MTDDPFANLDAAASATVSEEPADAVSDEDYFAAEMTIGEEEFEQPQERREYQMPEDKAWVPVTILTAKVGQRDMSVMVADGAGGKKAATVSVDRFELECQHLATAVYGERSYPYLLSVPVFDLELPTKRGTTWTKSSGRKLLAATRVTKPGQRITKDTLGELAEAMVGKEVMAQIRHVTKNYKDAEPLKGADGKFVKARVDADDEFIKIVKKGDDLVMDETGLPCPVPASELIKFDDHYLIPDGDGRMVKHMVETTRTFDNLADDVAPIPTRDVAYTKLDGKQGKGEVTIETVSAMATRPIKPGTEVSVLVKGGELIRLTWIGTAWNEVEIAGGTDLFKG